MRSNSYSIQAMPATPHQDNPEDNMGAQAVKTKHKLAVLRKIIPMRINECKKDCSTIHFQTNNLFTNITKNLIK